MGSAESKGRRPRWPRARKEPHDVLDISPGLVDDVLPALPCGGNQEQSTLLILPDEIIVYILGFIADPENFLALTLTCHRIQQLCADSLVIDGFKKRFTTNSASLLDLILIPGQERVLIQHCPTLPAGWKHGNEFVWNHAVKLQLMIRDGGLCLQGIIDINDKKISLRRQWKDDHIVGEEEKFFPDGQCEFVRFYNDAGQLDGEEKLWYEDGTLKERNFRRNGMLEGVQQAWHPDGNRSVLRLWRGGNLEGFEKQWNEDGDLITHVEWPINNRGKRRDFLLEPKEAAPRRRRRKARNPRGAPPIPPPR